MNTKYETGGNWDSDAVPFSTGKNSMALAISDGGTMTFDASSGKRQIDFLNVTNGSVLNMSGGVFDHSRAGNVVRTSIGLSGGVSTVNQTGGDMMIGHMLRLGGKGGAGVYNLSGGSLSVFRGGGSLMGGPFNPSISVGAGNLPSEFNISGGKLESRGGVEIGPDSSFNVIGSGASSITFGLSKYKEPGNWFQKGTLSFSIGTDGVTIIDIASGENGAPDVRFMPGSVLDLSFNGIVPFAGTWTLMEVEGAELINEGLALSPKTLADPRWAVKIDNSGVNGRLVATYLP
ncbi:MAG: hypothetical protein ACSHYA_17640 [Opitutaceae bacterium]